jgi:hypothetical protein
LLSFLIASINLNSRLQGTFNSKLSFLFFHSVILFISLNNVERTFKTSSLVLKILFFHQILDNTALKLLAQYDNSTEIFQLSSGLKFCISLSLSTINFTATD